MDKTAYHAIRSRRRLPGPTGLLGHWLHLAPVGSLLPFVLFMIAGCLGLTTSLQGALIDAVKDDNEGAVAALIAQKVDVNARQPDGATALAWAAVRNNPRIAELLLNAGADANLTNAYGIGPLSLAIQNRSAAMVRLLLAKDADPNVARTSGETPLMTAARTGQVEVMKLLLESGADANARETKFGQTALMWAAGDPDGVRLLLAHKADVKTKTKVWGVKYTIYIPTTFTLGKTGIPWNNDGSYIGKQGGQNALFFAVHKRARKSARLLLDASVDVNSAAADGTTPLLASLYKWVPPKRAFVPGTTGPARAGSSQVFGADPAMAQLLLDLGASAKASDGAGYTPLHGVALAVAHAAKSGDEDRTDEYRRHPALLALGKAEKDSLMFSVDEALAVARRLLDAGADPNQQSRHPTPGPPGDVRINPAPPGSSALHIAAASRNTDLVKLLLDAGADPNLLRKDGHSPFTVAVVANDLTAVKELAGRGVDLARRYHLDDKYPDPVKAVTLPRRDQTAMHLAAGNLLPEIVEFLHAQGAPLDLKNSTGETPLNLADHQERFHEAFSRQRADGDPKRLGAVTRPTKTTDLIKRLLASSKTKPQGR